MIPGDGKATRKRKDHANLWLTGGEKTTSQFASCLLPQKGGIALKKAKICDLISGTFGMIGICSILSITGAYDLGKGTLSGSIYKAIFAILMFFVAYASNFIGTHRIVRKKRRGGMPGVKI